MNQTYFEWYEFDGHRCTYTQCNLQVVNQRCSEYIFHDIKIGMNVYQSIRNNEYDSMLLISHLQALPTMPFKVVAANQKILQRKCSLLISGSIANKDPLTYTKRAGNPVIHSITFVKATVTSQIVVGVVSFNLTSKHNKKFPALTVVVTRLAYGQSTKLSPAIV